MMSADGNREPYSRSVANVDRLFPLALFLPFLQTETLRTHSRNTWARVGVQQSTFGLKTEEGSSFSELTMLLLSEPEPRPVWVQTKL